MPLSGVSPHIKPWGIFLEREKAGSQLLWLLCKRPAFYRELWRATMTRLLALTLLIGFFAFLPSAFADGENGLFCPPPFFLC